MLTININDTIRRTSPWGDVVVREIQSEQEVKNYLDMQKEGFDLEKLVNGEWVRVPKITVHRKPLEECEACSA